MIDDNFENEIWRDVPLEEFKDFYEISNYGRIKSKPRTILRSNRWNNSYEQYIGGNIIATRSNGKEAHLYSTLQFRHPKTKKVVSKTAYPHKLMAMAFIPKPNPDFDKVTFKDRDPTNLSLENLLWTDQSYLSIRNMIEHPHNRNKMGDYQKKIGVPNKEMRAKVLKLEDSGYDVYTIGEMVGRSRSWGYAHVKDIINENRKNKHQ